MLILVWLKNGDRSRINRNLRLAHRYTLTDPMQDR